LRGGSAAVATQNAMTRYVHHPRALAFIKMRRYAQYYVAVSKEGIVKTTGLLSITSPVMPSLT